MNLEELRRERDELADRERSLRDRVAGLETEVQHATRMFEPPPLRAWIWWFVFCAAGAFMMAEAVLERR